MAKPYPQDHTNCAEQTCRKDLQNDAWFAVDPASHVQKCLTCAGLQKIPTDKLYTEKELSDAKDETRKEGYRTGKDSGLGWGIILGIVFTVIAGALFYHFSSNNDQSAPPQQGRPAGKPIRQY